jgi:hypothetical protein
MTQANNIRLLNEALDALEQYYGPTHTITAIAIESDTTDCFNYYLTCPDGTVMQMYTRLTYDYSKVPFSRKVGVAVPIEG